MDMRKKNPPANCGGIFSALGGLFGFRCLALRLALGLVRPTGVGEGERLGVVDHQRVALGLGGRFEDADVIHPPGVAERQLHGVRALVEQRQPFLRPVALFGHPDVGELLAVGAIFPDGFQRRGVLRGLERNLQRGVEPVEGFLAVVVFELFGTRNACSQDSSHNDLHKVGLWWQDCQ